VLHCSGGGFSCYGFDVLDRKYADLWHEIRGIGAPTDAPNPSTLTTGTVETFDAWQRLKADAFAHHQRMRYRFTCELCPQLLNLEGTRVEVLDPFEDSKPRRFRVGRSTGWMPCHLEIESSDDGYGDAALSDYLYVRPLAGNGRPTGIRRSKDYNANYRRRW